MAPFDFDPAIYDLEAEPLEADPMLQPRPMPGMMAPPPIDFESSMQPEIPQYLPPQSHGFMGSLGGLADLQISAPIRGRGQNVAPFLIAALLRGVGQRARSSTAREEEIRKELNSRYKLAAADRNRQNLVVSGRAISGRQAELKAEAAMLRKVKEDSDPILSPGDLATYGLPIGLAGKRRSQLTPEQQAQVKPKTGLTGMGALYGEVDPEAIADAWHAGRAVPNLSLYGRVAGPAIATILEKKYKENAYAQDLRYKADVRFLSTQNQPRLVVLRQTINTTRKHMRRMLDLNAQLSQMIPRGAIPELNELGLGAAVRKAYGPRAGVVARNLQSQIGLLQSELATVFANGSSPTDEARDLARTMINTTWAPEQIEGSGDNIERDLKFKEQAMVEAQAVYPQQYAPNRGPAKRTQRWTKDAKGNPVPVEE